MIRIIAVGKKHDSWVASGVERYQKRLKQPWDIKWELIPHSRFEGDRARQDESERILSRLDPREYTLLLDEIGKNLSSPELSELLATRFTSSQPVVIVIGGAYGVSPALHERANLVWSLSRLVFPHQMVRLMLAEQLYRAQSIASGGAYHHE